MEQVLKLSEDNPNQALIYFMGLTIIVLLGAIRYLWKDRKAEEVKNFNMLLKAVDSFKDNAVAMNGLKNKVNQLIQKYG